MPDTSALLVWEKLQPTLNSNDIAQALRCEVHDPLWLLARQWQTGEFNAEDAGMAAFAHIISFSTPVQQFMGSQENTASVYNPLEQPLNTLTERIAPVFDLSFSIEAGRMWRKMLIAAGKSKAWESFRQNSLLHFKMPILKFEPDDPGMTAFSYEPYEQMTAAFANGRMIDGSILYNELQTHKASDFLPQADQSVNDLGVRWLRWISDTLGIKSSPHTGSWDASRLEYRASGSATLPGNEAVYLNMPEHKGQLMDSFAWEQTVEQPELKSGLDPSLVKIHRDTFIPAQVSFPGMPRARWWEFEDSTIDLSNIQAHKTELGLLLLSEFGLVYSNDWLLTPLNLPAGNLVKVYSMRITDVFGVQTYIRAAAQDDNWELFELTSEARPTLKGWIYLPPVANHYLQGPDLEEIQFIRDEMANLVWGVETIVPTGLGEGMEGLNSAKKMETWLSALAGNSNIVNESGLPDIGAAFTYQIGTTVPPNWIPFIPLRISDTDARIIFRRAAMPRFAGQEAPTRIRARSNILRSITDNKGHYDLEEEELPTTGLTVKQHWRRTRWIDGSTITWLAREKSIGRNYESSGLQFDQIV